VHGFVHGFMEYTVIIDQGQESLGRFPISLAAWPWVAPSKRCSR
jgi:hypothetical protein